MQQTYNNEAINLNISDNKFHLFLEFINTLDYVEVPVADNQSLNELQSSFNQVKMMQDGKIEKQSVEEFLNEV